MNSAEQWMESMEKRAEELGQYDVRIGLVGPNGSITYPDSNGITVSLVGLFNEFGTSRIPKRSWLRSTFVQKENEVFKILADAIEQILIHEKNVLDEYSKVGRMVSKLVYDKADSAPSWAVPNAQSTIDKKGSMKQLEDSKKMINAIGWAVYKGSSIQKYGLAKG